MRSTPLSLLQSWDSGAQGTFRDSLLLTNLSPKWESPIDPSAEFRLFLCMNRSGSLLSSATTHQLEIWDTNENSIREIVSDDFNGVSSMTWRNDDTYYLGSHNSTIRYYREGRCDAEFRGSSAWIRSLVLNSTEDLLIAGNVCSIIQLWNTETGRMLSVLNSSSEDNEDINVISAMAAHPSLPTVFISGARDGKISIWDIRCPDKLAWRFLAHSSKLSSLEFSENGRRILSSGREGVIRMWDARRLPPNEEKITDFLMEYAGHETYGHWVPAYFLNLEKFVLTGSETNKAFLYETETGQLAKELTLGTSKVIFTAPVPESVAFYYVNLSTQTIGLCDVGGEEVKPQEQTPLQIRQNFLKEKMQEVMLDYSDMIIHQLNYLGVLESTGLHQIIETLSRSPDPQSQEILTLLMVKYEERVRGSQRELANRIMTSAVLPSSIFQVEKGIAEEDFEMAFETIDRKTEIGPKVRAEVSYSKVFPQFLSQNTENKPDIYMKKVYRHCFLCHYCSEDGEP